MCIVYAYNTHMHCLYFGHVRRNKTAINPQAGASPSQNRYEFLAFGESLGLFFPLAFEQLVLLLHFMQSDLNEFVFFAQRVALIDEERVLGHGPLGLRAKFVLGHLERALFSFSY